MPQKKVSTTSARAKPRARPSRHRNDLKGGARGDVFRRQLARLIDREGSEGKLVARCEAQRADQPLSISPQSLNDWKNGVSLPRFEQLVWLAECTGVSLEWLCRGIGPEGSGVSRPPGTLAEDLGDHVVRAAAATLNVPAARAGDVLTVDSARLLDEFTSAILDRFRRSCAQFPALNDQAEAMYRAVLYLEQLLGATQAGIPGASPDAAERMQRAVFEVSEALLEHMPSPETLATQTGVWFRDYRAALSVLVGDAPTADERLGEVGGALDALEKHLGRVSRRARSSNPTRAAEHSR